MLMSQALEEADSRKLDVYVLTAPSARKFYLKQEFEHAGHSDVDLSLFAPERSGFGVYRYHWMKNMRGERKQSGVKKEN